MTKIASYVCEGCRCLRTFCAPTSLSARWYSGVFLLVVGFMFAWGCSAVPPRSSKKPEVDKPDTVRVAFDALGIPTIEARNREDAFFALGHATARDRIFQMDLLRRQMAGRLAELFGPAVLPSDKEQRAHGFERVARESVSGMKAPLLAVLQAYARGVNAYLAEGHELPLEFEALGYEPESWRPEDSMLVVLSMFQGLGGTQEQERTRTVLSGMVPPEVYEFLTSSSDRFTRSLLGSSLAEETEVPVAALRDLTKTAEGDSGNLVAATAGEARRGSNAWVIAGSKTIDGRAILANDMHLDLSVPNIWYRASLRYAERSLDGVFLPGIPVLIAGTNGHVAWGITSLEADVMDLVELEVDPKNTDRYRTPSGFREFEVRHERIRVRGAPDALIDVRSTIWGGVASTPLMGKQVAVRWSALDPEAVGIEMLDLDRVRSVAEGIELLTNARGPACNVLLADRHGDIAWTVTGRIPVRQGFDGSVSVSWADGSKHWSGYVPAQLLPRKQQPEEGMLVNANQRVAGAGALLLSHDYSNGSRAFRIAELLKAQTTFSEQELFALQLDTRGILFDFYRDLALNAAEREYSKPPRRSDGVLARALLALHHWDGHADLSSVGMGLLVRYRSLLASELVSPWVARCREAEPEFEFTLDYEAPIERILSERNPGTLPFGNESWDAYLLSVLERAAKQLEVQHSRLSIDQLTWGEMNHVRIMHPLGTEPGLDMLNMADALLPGCGFCVRVMSESLGATERLVVAPGHEKSGLFHMPGGQSGNPKSPNYRDQHQAWVQGNPLPLLAGPARASHTLRSSLRTKE